MYKQRNGRRKWAWKQISGLHVILGIVTWADSEEYYITQMETCCWVQNATYAWPSSFSINISLISSLHFCVSMTDVSNTDIMFPWKSTMRCPHYCSNYLGKIANAFICVFMMWKDCFIMAHQLSSENPVERCQETVAQVPLGGRWGGQGSLHLQSDRKKTDRWGEGSQKEREREGELQSNKVQDIKGIVCGCVSTCCLNNVDRTWWLDLAAALQVPLGVPLFKNCL